MKQLGVYAMRMIAPTTPGAPLCELYSDNKRFNGLQVSLKGGQIGAVSFFQQVREGGSRQ